MFFDRTISINNIPSQHSDFYLVERPNERFNDQDRYFAHEFKKIQQRRSLYGFKAIGQRPENLIGLALSGGGQRSAAFQLGLLSGLSKIPFGQSTLLNRIDYLSSVSGGSWASGAYWASKRSDEELFRCLDDATEHGKKNAEKDCQILAEMLRTTQEILPVQIKNGKLKQRKENWEDEITKIYLPDCNIEFWDKNRDVSCHHNFDGKPYPIFNSSHSVPVTEQGPSIDHFPFQTTPDYLGTIVDCKSLGIAPIKKCEKEGRIGFFVRHGAEGFSWSERKWQRFWKFWAPEDWAIEGMTLSKTLAHSSAVINAETLLQYDFDLKYQGKYIQEIRKRYELSDGGKTENLGLLPLIERSVDFIIVSYMGKDDPAQGPFQDLDLASKQVKRLLNCEVHMPKYQSKDKNLVFQSSYTAGGKEKIILHVKPMCSNVGEFKDYLRNQKHADGSPRYADIVEFLNNEQCNSEEDCFPQTPTIPKRLQQILSGRVEYDERLTRAYYLLGQYIAKNHISINLSKLNFKE